ncbi:MAG: DNA polymerase III subunit chi [Caulobacterales bacterium 32-69-10]|nr:MAG: DNA polymerase III subunit chi [Caulobacterales bacterium 32-69-10]
MTCEVWFYHLEQTALDQALPELLEKTLAKGWRALVRTPSPDRAQHLDDWLWSYREDSFLPHGVAGEPQDARQPVLITTGPDGPNGAQALFLLDGAEPGALDAYERCLILFDGRDEAAVAGARTSWKTLKGRGLPVSYWKQGERGWEKTA